MADISMKKRMQIRLQGMKAMRQPYESEAKEIASYTAPARSRWLASDTNKRRTPNKRLNNSHGIFAFRTLQGGMASGLSSGSRPWFSLGVYDDAMGEDPEVRAWLSEVERRMYAFIAGTNFYSAVKTGYLEMGAFGTEACVMLEHDEEGAVCHQLTFGEYWVAPGSALTVDALYRECHMSTLQAVQSFAKKPDGSLDRSANLSVRIWADYDAGRFDEIHTFIHAIERNEEYVEGAIGWKGKPWLSAYWDENDKIEDVVRKSGYEEQPFWAPRWDTAGGDAWGTGPGHDALPDLRELQLQTKRKAEATDMIVWPELLVAGNTKLKRQPKSVVSVAAADILANGGVQVINPIPYQALGLIREDAQTCESKIDRASYSELFMAITNMQGVQPRNMEEIASRNEEKLTQLGPVIERVNNEKLEVAIERFFGIMQRKQLFPPAPESMRDAPEIKIEFISILTQMQRMVGLGQIERTVSFVGNLAGLYPEARFKLDVNEIIDDYAARAGAPAKIIRTTADAEADAEAEAKQAQQAQAAEMAAKMAPVGKVAVDAAGLMADAPQNGTPAVEQLLPLLPR